MFLKFVPDKYYKSIYTVDYKILKRNKIKCLIFDLNNTIASIDMKEPSKKLMDLFEEFKDIKFKIYIVSNDTKKRVEPFKNKLGVDSSYCSFKPLLIKFKKIYRINKFKPEQIAVIGDGMIPDVYPANKMGFLSILVNPIGTKEYVSTKFERFFEGFIINKLVDKKLFRKGKYYE